MKRTTILTALLAALATTATAQSYTDHLREQRSGHGTVIIEQSNDIENLVNGSATPHEKATTDTPKKPSDGENAPKHKTTAPKTQGNEAETDEPTGADEAVDTRRKVMRGQKVSGYRVQVYAGGNSRADKNKAQRVGDAMKEAFPTLPVFVHFYSPRWVCRIGNFVEREEANECLRQVKSLGYGQACVVRGTVTVR